MKLIDLVMILVLFGSPVRTILAEGEEAAASTTEVRAESEPAVAEESTSSEEPVAGQDEEPVTGEDEESADETEVTQEKPSGSPQVSEDQALEILEALHEDQDSTIDGVAGEGQEGSPDEARDQFLSLLTSDPLEGAAGGEGATASRGFDSLFRNRQLLMGGEVCHDCHDSEKERAGRGGFTLDLLGPSGSFSGERRAEPAGPTWPSRVVSVGGFLGMGATEVDMGPVLMGADPAGLSNLMRERAEEGAAELKDAGLLDSLPDPHDFQDFGTWQAKAGEVHQQIDRHYYGEGYPTPRAAQNLIGLRSQIARAYFGLPPVEPAKFDPRAPAIRAAPGTPEAQDAALEAFRWQTQNWSSFERNAALIMLPASVNPNPANFDNIVGSLGGFARGGPVSGVGPRGPMVTGPGRAPVAATAPMMPGPARSAVRFTTAPKIADQMPGRGWTPRMIEGVIAKPVRTVTTRDTRNVGGGVRNNDPATGYIDATGNYVVRNDRTGDIVQISNRNDPNWIAPW